MSPFRRVTATNHTPGASSGPSVPEPQGRQTPRTLIAVPAPQTVDSRCAPAQTALTRPVAASTDWRLHSHADYQRVYQTSRKQFASLLTFFSAQQPADRTSRGPRVGITAGKALGKAVERNRIKRRMRAAIVANLKTLPADVDVVLHPRYTVLTAEWAAVRNEVRRIFVMISEERERRS